MALGIGRDVGATDLFPSQARQKKYIRFLLSMADKGDAAAIHAIMDLAHKGALPTNGRRNGKGKQ